MAVELGTGYVSLTASAKGIANSIRSELGAPLETAATQSGAKASAGFVSKFAAGIGGLKTVALGAGGVIAGAFAGGAALERIGSSFDAAFDRIRIGTGKTGPELQGLQDTFKTVFASNVTSMDEASNAVTVLNEKLGLTGGPLTAVAGQILKLSRITGTDLGQNLDAVTGLFNQFGVNAAGARPKLDELFRISQQTGVSVTDLASQMADSGPVFKQAGLTFEQSGALLGLLGKNGLSVADVLPAISKSLAVAAKTGKPAQQVFADTFAAIRNAPTDTKAAGIALDVFGARAGPKFAALIRSGKLSYQDFARTIAAGGDTINRAAAQTDDWREKLTLLKNRALVALEPLASKVFTGLTTGIERAAPAIQNAVAAFSAGFTGTDTTGFLGGLGKATADFVAVVKRDWPAIRDTIAGALTQIRAIISGVVDIVSTIWRNFHNQIMAVVRSVWQQMGAQIKAALLTVKGIIDTISALIHGDWSGVWKGLGEIVRGVFSGIVAMVTGALQRLKAVLSAAWVIVRAVTAAAWAQVRKTVGAAVDGIVSFIRGLPGRAVAALSSLGSLLSGVFSRAWTSARTAMSNVVSSILSFVRGIPGKISGALGNLGSLLVSKGSSLMAGLLSGITSGYRAAAGFVAGIPGRIASSVGDLSSRLFSAGYSLIRGFWDGMRSGLSNFLHSIHIPIPRIHIPGTNINIGGGTITLASGGIVKHRPGGVLAVLGEGGLDEAVIPLPRVRPKVSDLSPLLADARPATQIVVTGNTIIGPDEATIARWLNQALTKGQRHGGVQLTFRAA